MQPYHYTNKTISLYDLYVISEICGCKNDNFQMKNLKHFVAAPVADWVRSLNFSALNHSIISPLCLM